MPECELLPNCMFFKKHEKSHEVTCQSLISEYCRGHRQSECKRKEHLVKKGEQPPENMLPGGSIIKLDAQVFGRSPGLNTQEKRMPKARAGTGISVLQNAAPAGCEAARLAVEKLEGELPALVIVFTTPRYNLQELLEGVRSITGPATLIGATGSGQLTQGEYLGFGAGVSVLALTGGPYRFGSASAGNIRGNLDRVGQDIARASREAAGPSKHSTLLLLADALAGDLQELVKGVYRITGPRTPIVGGAAGDELKFVRTFVFHNDQVIEGGAVGLWIASDFPLPVVTRHGWSPIGVPLLVTRAEGTEILELGGRPAAEAYEEQLGLNPGELTPDKFWGTSILHPFGLLQTDGSCVIRVARSKTEDGTLRIQGCVPPAGSAVQVMTGTSESLLDIVEEITEIAVGTHPRPAAVLGFSCAARMAILGKQVPEEARRLQAAAGDVATFGFYCCGEFARSIGILGTHNATLTTLTL